MKRLVLVSACFFVILLLLSYPTLFGPNIYDDKAIFQENTYVKNHDYKAQWLTPYWAGVQIVKSSENLYRPLFLNLVTLFQDQTWILKLLLIVSHSLVSLLLVLTLERMGLPFKLALGAGSMYLIHPAHTEVLAQIIGLMEVLPLLMGLAALLFIKTSPWWSVLLVAFLPGIKETGFIAIGFVSILFLLRRQTLYFSASVFAGFIWLALRYFASGSMFEFKAEPYALLNPLVDYSFFEQLWSRFTLIGYNLRLLAWPHPLTSDYSLTTLPLPGYPLQVWVLLSLAFITFTFKQRKNWPPEFYFGLLMLLPTLHILAPIGIVFAERFGYAFRWSALIFVFYYGAHLVIPWRSLQKLERQILIVVGLSVNLIFATLSWDRYNKWSHPLSLFSEDVERFPFNAKAHFNLGVAYGASGDWDPAKTHLIRSLDLAPDFAEAHFRLGMVFRELKMESEAQKHWSSADQLGYHIPRKQ